jgi:hypothetical protein
MNHVTPTSLNNNLKANNANQNNINYFINNSNITVNKQENYNINNNILVINKFAGETPMTPIKQNNVVIIKNVENPFSNEREILFGTSGKNEKNERVDRKGVVIVKGGKKHRVTFIDKIGNRKSLIDMVDVESYKKFNIINTFSEAESRNSAGSLNCCIIF